MPSIYSTPIQSRYVPQFVPLPVELFAEQTRYVQQRQDQASEFQDLLQVRMAEAGAAPVAGDLAYLEQLRNQTNQRLETIAGDEALYKNASRLRTAGTQFARDYAPIQQRNQAFREERELAIRANITGADLDRRMADWERRAGDLSTMTPEERAAAIPRPRTWSPISDVAREIFPLLERIRPEQWQQINGVPVNGEVTDYGIDGEQVWITTTQGERVTVGRIDQVFNMLAESNPAIRATVDDEVYLQMGERGIEDTPETRRRVMAEVLGNNLEAARAIYGYDNTRGDIQHNPERLYQDRLRREAEEATGEGGNMIDVYRAGIGDSYRSVESARADITRLAASDDPADQARSRILQAHLEQAATLFLTENEDARLAARRLGMSEEQFLQRFEEFNNASAAAASTPRVTRGGLGLGGGRHQTPIPGVPEPSEAYSGFSREERREFDTFRRGLNAFVRRGGGRIQSYRIPLDSESRVIGQEALRNARPDSFIGVSERDREGLKAMAEDWNSVRLAGIAADGSIRIGTDNHDTIIVTPQDPGMFDAYAAAIGGRQGREMGERRRFMHTPPSPNWTPLYDEGRERTDTPVRVRYDARAQGWRVTARSGPNSRDSGLTYRELLNEIGNREDPTAIQDIEWLRLQRESTRKSYDDLVRLEDPYQAERLIRYFE